jgi:CheY-like chemotaxis protein
MPTVLVVDDSVIDRRRAAGLLERSEPYSVLYADDGLAALKQLQVAPVDVVLTDLTMPGMGGLELVTEMRDKHPGIPVVLMTSQGNEDVAVQALRSGAASYVPKRKLATDLARTLSSVIAAGKAERAASDLLQHRSRVITSFSLLPSLSLVSAVAPFVLTSLADIWRCEARDLMNFGIAVEEALLNALYYGTLEIDAATRHSSEFELEKIVVNRAQQTAYRDRRIFVETRFTPMQATIVVRDEGPGFDTSKLPDPDDVSTLNSLDGRGLRLMHMFTDQVTWNVPGNEVTLTRRRPRRKK